jgi:hypothetical protein
MPKLLFVIAFIILSVSGFSQANDKEAESRNQIIESTDVWNSDKLSLFGFRIDSVIGISNPIEIEGSNYAKATVMAHRHLSETFMLRMYHADLKAEGINADSAIVETYSLLDKSNFYKEWQSKYEKKFGANNVIIDRVNECAKLLSNDVVTLYFKFDLKEAEGWFGCPILPTSLLSWPKMDNNVNDMLNYLIPSDIQNEIDDRTELFPPSINN